MEAGVHPRPGPDVARVEVVVVLRAGVGVGDRERLLVADERAVGRAVGAVGDVPAGLPVDFVAAPEEQVDAGIARFLDVGALVARPVFVMADRDERLVVLEVVGPEPVGVDARDVGDVVALLLEPVDRRIVGAEQIVLRARGRAGAVVGDEGAIVADRVGAVLREAAGARDRVPVDAVVRVAVEVGADLAVVAAPGIVGLPGRVGGLQDDVVALAVVAHDEGDLVDGAVDRVAVRIEALQAGEVDAGDGVGRHVPAVGHRPVAGVDHAARGVDERVRLDRGVGVRPLGDLAGTATAVVAKAEDLDLVVAARAAVDVDLEVNARAGVDAHVGGEAFDLACCGLRPSTTCRHDPRESHSLGQSRSWTPRRHALARREKQITR